MAKKNDVPIFVDPVSSVKAKKLIGLLGGISIVTPNQYELKILSDRIEDYNFKTFYGQSKDKLDMNYIKLSAIELLKIGVKNIVVTLGSKGVLLVNRDVVRHYHPFKTQIIEITGAGDGFFAGMVYGLYCYNNDIEKAVKYGLCVSAITVNSDYTVSKLMNKKYIEEQMNETH